MQFKKRIIFFGLILYSFLGFSQNGKLNGFIRNGISFEPSENISVSLLNYNDNKLIENTITDINGKFEIKNIKEGAYKLKFYLLPYHQAFDTIVNIYNDSIISIKINYPCPNGLSKSIKVCPLGHKNKIIPITYGLHSKRTIKKAEKGKIKLGGCIVTECNPKWYCKVHEISF